ncbi:Hypothetical protein SRAE_0000076400 [Strongyloides ratti]|uniref:Uncharacterized protein n=1 Tax=Strongyloides ratti TaxID=34506 RepID=A0A090L2G7_STRRB|nr:Hypothetical protein SRAE_0000076400 [Strongyloides ratti]CEF61649.1 Hypothetical protein SRAE_0000076400 [Strongyloides ratti]
MKKNIYKPSLYHNNKPQTVITKVFNKPFGKFEIKYRCNGQEIKNLNSQSSNSGYFDHDNNLCEDLERNLVGLKNNTLKLSSINKINNDENIKHTKDIELTEILKTTTLEKIYTSPSEIYENINWSPHLKNVFNDSNLLKVLTKFKLSINILERITMKKNNNSYHYRKTFLSQKAINDLVFNANKSNDNGFCEMKKILFVVIKHYLICYKENIDGVSFLKFNKNKLLNILSKPLPFSIRNFLFIYLILVASCKNSKEKYNIDCIPTIILILHNIIMPNFVGLSKKELKENISEMGDCKFRIMVNIFKDEYCNSVAADGLVHQMVIKMNNLLKADNNSKYLIDKKLTLEFGVVIYCLLPQFSWSINTYDIEFLFIGLEICDKFESITEALNLFFHRKKAISNIKLPYSINVVINKLSEIVLSLGERILETQYFKTFYVVLKNWLKIINDNYDLIKGSKLGQSFRNIDYYMKRYKLLIEEYEYNENNRN